MASLVVYTALFGAHEKLLEQDVARSSSARFICLTDDASLTSSTWEIGHVEPLFPADPRRSQRDIKIRGHQLLHESDVWMYIDNTVRLKAPPEKIVDAWLGDADWAAINQPQETLWAEFEKNRELSKEVESRLNEQLSDYSTHHRDALDSKPVWNGFFVRRNNEKVASFAELWFAHVCRYAARDQLSMMVALGQRPLELARIDAGIRNSEWHDWPHREGETAKGKSYRHARPSSLKSLAEQAEALREENRRLAEENLQLADQRLFGLAGIRRRFDERRRERRRQQRQARKRQS